MLPLEQSRKSDGSQRASLSSSRRAKTSDWTGEMQAMGDVKVVISMHKVIVFHACFPGAPAFHQSLNQTRDYGSKYLSTAAH